MHHLLYIAHRPEALAWPSLRTIELPEINARITIETPRTLNRQRTERLRGIILCRAIGLEHLDLYTRQVAMTRISAPEHECPLANIDMSAYTWQDRP